VKRFCIALAAVAALLVVWAPSALAAQPVFVVGPDVDILNGQQHIDTPPAIPQVGDTLWGNNGSPYCDPACDPNAPSQQPQPFQILLPGNGEPPSGQFFSWRRCSGNGCVEVQGKSTTVNTYIVKPADAGSQLQFVVTLTTYDCGEVRRDNGQQECRWVSTTGTANTATVAQPQTVAVTPTNLADGVAGQAYSQTLSASGGTGPYAYSVVSGALPAGVTLSAGGTFSGTPTQAGTYKFKVQATGSGASPGTRDYTIVVHLGMTTTLGNGVTGVAYSQALTSTGAQGAVAYSVGAGALPDGLSISGAQIVGTPTKQGAFTFTVHAVDAAGGFADQQYTVQVAYPAVTLAPEELPEVIRNVAYHVQLTATGGTAPYAFTLQDGDLPKGLRLSSDGVISGRGLEDGTTTLDLKIGVTDKYGAPATKDYTLAYYGPTITLAPAKLKKFTVGKRVGVRLRAAGGTAPYAFEVARGKLPAGLGLAEGGVLRGTPKTAGTFRATVRVTDRKGATQLFLLRLVVVAAA
jgi:hypothetical protein